MIDTSLLRARIRSKFLAIAASATLLAGLLAGATFGTGMAWAHGVDDDPAAARVSVTDDFGMHFQMEDLQGRAAEFQTEDVSGNSGRGFEIEVHDLVDDSSMWGEMQPGELRGRDAEIATEDVQGNADEVGELRGRDAEIATEDIQGKAPQAEVEQHNGGLPEDSGSHRGK